MASTLTSASTLADVQAAYDDNASYAEDASTTKAAAFITACRILLRRVPQRVRQGGTTGAGQEMQHNPETLQAELKTAQAWYEANVLGGSHAGSVRYLSFEDYR